VPTPCWCEPSTAGAQPEAARRGPVGLPARRHPGDPLGRRWSVGAASILGGGLSRPPVGPAPALGCPDAPDARPGRAGRPPSPPRASTRALAVSTAAPTRTTSAPEHRSQGASARRRSAPVATGAMLHRRRAGWAVVEPGGEHRRVGVGRDPVVELDQNRRRGRAARWSPPARPGAATRPRSDRSRNASGDSASTISDRNAAGVGAGARGCGCDVPDLG